MPRISQISQKLRIPPKFIADECAKGTVPGSEKGPAKNSPWSVPEQSFEKLKLLWVEHLGITMNSAEIFRFNSCLRQKSGQDLISSDVVEILDISEATFKQLVRHGQIKPMYKKGGRIFFDPQSIMDFWNFGNWRAPRGKSYEHPIIPLSVMPKLKRGAEVTYSLKINGAYIEDHEYRSGFCPGSTVYAALKDNWVKYDDIVVINILGFKNKMRFWVDIPGNQ